MKNLFIVAAIGLLLAISAQASQKCVNSDECSSAELCELDITGRGICVPATQQDGSVLSLGNAGSPCSMPTQCNQGYICARPKGYLSMGFCALDLKNERPE